MHAITAPAPVPPAYSSERRTPPLQGLNERGQIANSSRYHQVEGDLAISLLLARKFGSEYGSPAEWNRIWRQRWNQVEGMVRRINRLVAEMDEAIASGDVEQLGLALISWEALQLEDSLLVDALNELRTQATALNPGSRPEIGKVSAPPVTRIQAAEAEAASDAAICERGELELGREPHQGMGLMETLKTMCVWMETPDERIRNTRSLRMDPRQPSTCSVSSS